MSVVRLNEGSINAFVAAPEDAMGYHLGLHEDTACLVIACRVALVPDEVPPETALDQLRKLDPDPGPGEAQIRPLALRWSREGLSATPALVARLTNYLSALVGPLPSPVAPSVYGHIPFWTTTAKPTTCYRFECFPTSRKIDLGKRLVAVDTFAAPFPEAPFVPSGFAAVGRYALPNLLPHCWRYELTAPAGTLMRCGAVVPQFGQSGGGVELYFPNGFTNAGPIAKPVVLPEY